MRLEIMYTSSNIEKVINPLIQNLRRGGIQASARLVDPAQGTNRLRSFDFDLVHTGLLNFYPPNVDLTSRWSSEYAGVQGSENYNGLKDPVMDEMLTYIEKADSWETIRAAARAVDRYEMSLFLGIPTYWNGQRSEERQGGQEWGRTGRT